MMLDRTRPTAVGLAGAAMAVAASLVSIVVPAARAPIPYALGRSVVFAPIGALCALFVWWLRRGRSLPTSLHLVYLVVAAGAGALLIVLIDLAVGLVRPDTFNGVSGADVIVGAFTGSFAGHVGALKPVEKR
jgi:hypothetical protein